MTDSGASPHETYIQVAGDGYRMSTASLLSAIDESRSLERLLLRFSQTFLIQVSHTTVANARGKLEERLARWLLMAHDRIGEDELPITHRFLALMLGVRRAGVTETIAKLEEKNMIQAERGIVRVMNRGALEKQAGALYGVPEDEYRRLIGL